MSLWQNFAGLLGSKASRAVLVTLFSVFTQCRAFGDALEKDRGRDELVNMVCRVAFPCDATLL
jgi:hypothetical protein